MCECPDTPRYTTGGFQGKKGRRKSGKHADTKRLIEPPNDGRGTVMKRGAGTQAEKKQ